MKQGKNYLQFGNTDYLGDTSCEGTKANILSTQYMTDGSWIQKACKGGSIITIVQTRKLNVQGACLAKVTQLTL